jgi:hypothetical protein
MSGHSYLLIVTEFHVNSINARVFSRRGNLTLTRLLSSCAIIQSWFLYLVSEASRIRQAVILAGTCAAIQQPAMPTSMAPRGIAVSVTEGLASSQVVSFPL